MIGSFLTRIITMALGYIYPAYECFKTVEQRRPNVEVLRFWCQYWIIIAIVTVVERFGDVLISWLPMYSEAKLAFIVYLWYPKTRGTSYIYQTFLRPYVTSHENEIDQHLSDLRARTLDFVVQYWQRGSAFGQQKFFDILQFLASQNRQPQQQPAAPQNYNPIPPPPPAPPVQQAPQNYNAVPPPPSVTAVVPQVPQGPPNMPAGYFPAPAGYEASAPMVPPGPVFRGPPPPPSNLPDDPNYRPGFYPSPMQFQPPAQPPSQPRATTLREEINLSDDEEQEEYIMPPANGPTSTSSSSRYMTRSRLRANVNTSNTAPNRGW